MTNPAQYTPAGNYIPATSLIDGSDGETAAAIVTGPFTGVKGLRVYGGPTDPISDIPVYMPWEHHQVHEGETFRATDEQLSIGAGTVKYGFTVPTYTNLIRVPHLVIDASVYNGAVLIRIYEGATFTSGSTVAVNNRNRNSSNVAGASVKTGVTSTDGTLKDSFFVGAGQRAAATERAATEWVLKNNTIYRIDVVGQTAGTAAVIGFDWYEDLGV